MVAGVLADQPPPAGYGYEAPRPAYGVPEKHEVMNHNYPIIQLLLFSLIFFSN